MWCRCSAKQIFYSINKEQQENSMNRNLLLIHSRVPQSSPNLTKHAEARIIWLYIFNVHCFTVSVSSFDLIYEKKKSLTRDKRSKVMPTMKRFLGGFWKIQLSNTIWNMDVNMDAELNINAHSIQYAACAFVESSGLCHSQTNDTSPVKLSCVSVGGTDLIWLYIWDNRNQGVLMHPTVRPEENVF